jgi:peptidoglycan/LPS O-acetylase OafA/YrhL
MKIKYYRSLDGVRGLAALMVMFFHFWIIVTPGDSLVLKTLVKVSIFGQTGVTLFFVLSGFLITRILINAKGDSHYFSNFYIRRALRILPLYYLFLILYYFVTPLFTGEQVADGTDQLSYWFYLQNFAKTFNWSSAGPLHYWSLAVEEHFYLIWPLLVYFLSVKQLKKSIWIIYGIAILSRIILLALDYDVFYFTLTNMDSLAIGGLLAIHEREKKLKPTKFYRNGFLFSIIPVVVLWFFVGGKALAIVQVIKPIFINGIYFFMIGYVVSAEKGVIKSLFRGDLLRYTGKISYGLYIYHGAIFEIIRQNILVKNVFLLFTISFASSYVVASISYYCFENIFLSMKRYFKDHAKEMEKGIDAPVTLSAN